jgi:hypothetical protein
MPQDPHNPAHNPYMQTGMNELGPPVVHYMPKKVEKLIATRFTYNVLFFFFTKEGIEQDKWDIHNRVCFYWEHDRVFLEVILSFPCVCNKFLVAYFKICIKNHI